MRSCQIQSQSADLLLSDISFWKHVPARTSSYILKSCWHTGFEQIATATDSAQHIHPFLRNWQERFPVSRLRQLCLTAWLSSSPCFELRPFSCATTLEWLCSRLVASRRDEPWKKESVSMTSCEQKTSQPVALSTMTTQTMLEMKILWRESLVQFLVAINKGFMYSNLVRTCAWSEQFRPPAVQRHGFMMGPNGLSVVMSCTNPPCPRSGTLNIHSKMVLLWNKHFNQTKNSCLLAKRHRRWLKIPSVNLDFFLRKKKHRIPTRFISVTVAIGFREFGGGYSLTPQI